MHNADGFWDEAKASKHNPIVEVLPGGRAVVVPLERKILNPTEALAYAVHRKSEGTTERRVFDELVRQGVKPDVARPMVKSLYEVPDRKGFLSIPGMRNLLIGIAMISVDLFIAATAVAIWNLHPSLVGTGGVFFGIWGFFFFVWGWLQLIGWLD